MRGDDREQGSMFSYRSLEDRIRQDHPLRPMRAMVDRALEEVSPRFAELYARTGWPSIPPERLLRALLPQILFSVRSERQLMEALEYNLLYRWFVGLGMDDAVWVPTKNRDRLLEGDVARAFFDAVLGQAAEQKLLSSEHFSVDGTLIEVWASHKSFLPKARRSRPNSRKKRRDRERERWPLDSGGVFQRAPRAARAPRGDLDTKPRRRPFPQKPLPTAPNGLSKPLFSNLLAPFRSLPRPGCARSPTLPDTRRKRGHRESPWTRTRTASSRTCFSR
jgi:transposase